MLKLEIVSKIDQEQLIEAIGQLNDKQKADLAIRFGEGGDMNYELILLKNLIDLIKKVYPPKGKDDVEMSKLSKSLLELKPLIESLIEKK